MKVIGINAGPRKGWNSDQMLDHALQGAAAQGAEVEKIHLFDLKNFSGCRSCFACKRLNGPSFGRCGWKDDLKPVLDSILEADLVLISMPIYFGEVPGAARSLMERIWFPGLLYSADGSIAYTKKVKVGLIYTMNVPDPSVYKSLFENYENLFQRFLGPARTLCASNTMQFDDYSKYASSMFDPAAKKAHHDEHFPLDCEAAYRFGAELAAL